MAVKVSAVADVVVTSQPETFCLFVMGIDLCLSGDLLA